MPKFTAVAAAKRVPASATGDFAFLFLRSLMAREHATVVFSPASIYVALALLCEGARGATQREILDFLRQRDAECLRSEVERLLGSAVDLADWKLSMCNAVWIAPELEVRPEFVSKLQQHFAAELRRINRDAVAHMNAWVREKTHGKIQYIISSLSPLEQLVLINAIYFKSPWSEAFSRNATAPVLFTSLDGNARQVAMMRNSSRFPYLETSTFQAVSLPYQHPRLAMMVILPRKDADFVAFCRELTAEQWYNWIDQLEVRRGELQLPRFTCEHRIDIGQIARAAGLGSIFDPYRADWGNMLSSPAGAALTQAQHATYLRVDEEGTEAAAVTSITMFGSALGMPQPERPFRMIVDHPFICAIADTWTGALLFVGAICEVAASE